MVPLTDFVQFSSEHQKFIEQCLEHQDPRIRTQAMRVAIKRYPELLFKSRNLSKENFCYLLLSLIDWH